MADRDAMFIGVEQIMDAFDRLADNPYYSVWQGKDICFRWIKNDTAEGRAYLLENLLAFHENENRAILKIKFYDKLVKGNIDDKTPVIATLFVRVCPWIPYDQYKYGNAGMSGTGSNDAIAKALTLMSSQFSALNEKLSNQDDFDPNEDLERLERIENFVDRLLDKPLINNALGKIFNIKTDMAKSTQPAIGNVPIDQQYDQAISILREADKKWNQHIIKLAEIAQKNRNAFKLLILELDDFEIVE